jgi:predicted HTH transcriptional regulator
MTRRRFIEIIEEGEGLKVEFKRKFTTHEKIAKEIIALANTRGGVILVGVDDDGSICGVRSEKEETELFKQAARDYCIPEVNFTAEYFEIDGNEVVVFSIPESPLRPHRIQDYLPELDINSAHVYIRVNDKSVFASKEMIKIMQANVKGKPLENYTVGKDEKITFNYLDEHERITVKELKEAANISARRASRTLIKLVRANLLFIHSKENGEDYFTYSGQ